jgi:NADPH:quinone reductase-like Zn-dependent oxidoreductase
VQIAKATGATVIGTAKAARHDFLRGLGAEQVIDYTATRFEDEVSDVDVVLDLIGGETSLRSVSTLRTGGLLIVVPSGADQSVLGEAEHRGVRATNIMVEPDYPALEQIAELAQSGRLRVEIDAVFPLEEAAGAHEHGESRSGKGKIALSVVPDDSLR